MFKSALLLALTMATGAAPPEEMPVPVKTQGIIIKKVLDYVTTLEEDGLKILVIYANQPSQEVDEMILVLENVGLSPNPVALGQLSTNIESAAAIYVLPGVDGAEVRQLCGTHKVLSFSGVPELAEGGVVSIGIGKENNKPQIIVNMSTLQSEGHKLSSELLRLAKVIE